MSERLGRLTASPRSRRCAAAGARRRAVVGRNRRCRRCGAHGSGSRRSERPAGGRDQPTRASQRATVAAGGSVPPPSRCCETRRTPPAAGRRRRRGDSGSRVVHDGRLDHPGEAARMSSRPGFARSGRQPLAAAPPPGPQNSPATATAHPLPEPVPPRPAAYIRLVRPLHFRSSLRRVNPLLPMRTQRVAPARRVLGPGAARTVETAGPDRRPDTTRPSHATGTRWRPQPRLRGAPQRAGDGLGRQPRAPGRQPR